MSLVTRYLHNLIARQVDEHRTVLWFDPEQHYGALLDGLRLPGTTVLRYEGSFYALRAAIDASGLLDGDSAPRLLVYLPLSEEASQDALVELAAVGAVLKPGHPALQRNTRLSVLARRALRDSLGAEKAEELAAQIEAGKLGLEDLERISISEGASAVLVSIFGAGDPHDLALLLLGSQRFDAALTARGATEDLAHLLGSHVGAQLPVAGPDVLRAALARHVLASDLLAGLGDRRPSELAGLPLPDSPGALQACAELARTWRLRRDLQASYVAQAERIEQSLGLAQISFSISEARASATFVALERALQAGIEVALRSGPSADLLELAQTRASGFWAEQRPALQARWNLIITAGCLLAEAARIEQALRQPPGDPAAILRAYAEGEQPWCLLDTYQRQMERRWHTLELSEPVNHQTLEDLVGYARRRFMQVGDALATGFTRALAQARFSLPGLARQRDTFDTLVAPALADGKTAYILVDALRFEMARELHQSFDAEYQPRLTMAVGTLPGITEIGMAALMPGAGADAAVVPAGEGRVALRIGATGLKDRRTRLEWLRQQVAAPVAVATLEDLLPRPKPALEQELKQARLIVITSQEIDELAESDNIRLARRVMDDVLPDLARLVRRLREYGCKNIVIAADHGYLFGDELESDMKLDPPGGQTVDLHRRVWVGRGGAASEGYLRANLSSFGLSPDLEIAVPWGFGAFKVPGGARAYFHGGMSPQELVIPLLVLHPTTVGAVTPLSAIEWDLVPGTKKIANRFVSIQIRARSTSLFAFEPPQVRVEVRSKGAVVAQPVSATYGLNSGTHEITLRTLPDDPQQTEPNTITLMISDTPGKTASVHLLDAESGRELARIERIEVTLPEL